MLSGHLSVQRAGDRRIAEVAAPHGAGGLHIGGLSRRTAGRDGTPRAGRCAVPRDISRTEGHRHSGDIQGQGRLRAQRQIRGGERQEDAGAGLHRRALPPRHE